MKRPAMLPTSVSAVSQQAKRTKSSTAMVQMNVQTSAEMAVSGEVPQSEVVHRDQGPVEVQVEMAATGEGVCTVHLPCGTTIRDLKRSISDQLSTPMMQLSLLLGPLLLTNDDARLADVFTDSLDGHTVVQLVLMTPEHVLEDVKKTRQALARASGPPIQEMIDAGIVPTYVGYLAHTTWPELQFEAGWALTNMLAGTTEQTRVVVDHGAVPAFIDQLASPHQNVQDQAVWALANIAGDSFGLRDDVLRAGALTRVVEIAKSLLVNGGGHRQNLMWAIANMVKGKPKPALLEVKPLLSCLDDFLRCEVVEDLSDLCWAAASISGGSNGDVQALIDTGCIPRVMELLVHEDVSVQKPALRVVRNVVSGDDTQTQLILDAGILRAGHALLTHQSKDIRSVMCQTLSNITAGKVEHVVAVIESGLIPEILRKLRDDSNQISKEAFLAIANALRGISKHGSDPSHIQNLLDLGCLDAVLDVLSTQDEFRESRDGRELMHELRNHPNEVVNLRSNSVLEALGTLASSNVCCSSCSESDG